MPTDPRVDAYIARQADFARPILDHLRRVAHAASPDIGEAIKWGMPFFTYHDQNLANMAGFKKHVAFGFWHDKVGRESARGNAMGQFGRITRLSDLPSEEEIGALVTQATALIDAGDRPRAGPKAVKPPRAVHPAFQAALDANPAALAVWAAFTPGKVRDYCEWIGEAKTDATRDKRVATAVEWIAQGKDRNWKYRKG
jgi:uncharacterized protein YdeI (YjbR/CyaY-like superfamily)